MHSNSIAWPVRREPVRRTNQLQRNPPKKHMMPPLFCGGIMCFLGGFLCNWLVLRTGSRRTGQAMLLLCIAEAAHDLGQGANWASIVDIGGKYAGVAAGLINTIGNMGNAFQ